MKINELLESENKVDVSTLSDKYLSKYVTRMKKHIRNGTVIDLKDAAVYTIDDFHDSGVDMSDEDWEKLTKRLMKLFRDKHGTFKQNSTK